MEQISYAASDGGIDLIPGYRHKLTQASIGECNLWGRLREVVVGTPEGTILPNYEAVNEKVTAPEFMEMMRKYGGKLAKDIRPDYYAALEEAKATAPCAVNIDSETVVLPREAPRTRKAVSNLGFHVLDVEFSVHAMAAGGIRCAIDVIYREID